MSRATRVSTLSARAGNIAKRVGVSLLDPGDDLIDWYEVAGVAMDIAVDDVEQLTTVPDGAAHEFEAYIREAIPVVAEYTGLTAASALEAPVVFSREEWIAISAENMKPLLELLIVGFSKSVSSGQEVQLPNRFVRAALSGELGLVLGYLGRRVLGQYDPGLLQPSGQDGRVYFIYPNIVEAEARLGIEPRSFRLWLALHEVTHGFEFEANPWIKKYIEDLIAEQNHYLETRMARQAPQPKEDDMDFDQLIKTFTGGVYRQMMSPDENPVLAKIQSLMSVLEGYSEHVMEVTGSMLIEEAGAIGELIDHARKNRHWIHRIVEKAIRLEVKMEQYKLGNIFIKNAVDAGGMELANKVWEGPTNMPTLTELRQPELWVTRMLKRRSS